LIEGSIDGTALEVTADLEVGMDDRTQERTDAGASLGL
jgi:hypothetical protein